MCGGLSDNLDRNRAQAYTNVELRHAVQVAPRWAVQGVLFSDFGAFQSFTEEGAIHRLAGNRQHWGWNTDRPDIPVEYAFTDGFRPSVLAESEFPDSVRHHSVFLSQGIDAARRQNHLFLNQRKGYAKTLDKSRCVSTGFELGF